MDESTAFARLDECVLLAGVPAELRKEFAGVGELRTVSKSEVVVYEGHQSDSLFVVLSGVLAVEKNTDTGPRCLAFISPVDVFGELAMFHSMQRSSSVRAIDESVIFEVGYSDLKSFIESSPQVLWNISTLVAKRLEAMNTRALAENVSSKHQEVLDFMARMGNALARGRGSDATELVLSPGDIQQMTAMSKQIVIDAVEDLVQQKIAAVRSGKVHIKDIGALERYSTELRDWI